MFILFDVVTTPTLSLYHAVTPPLHHTAQLRNRLTVQRDLEPKLTSCTLQAFQLESATHTAQQRWADCCCLAATLEKKGGESFGDYAVHAAGK